MEPLFLFQPNKYITLASFSMMELNSKTASDFVEYLQRRFSENIEYRFQCATCVICCQKRYINDNMKKYFKKDTNWEKVVNEFMVN